MEQIRHKYVSLNSGLNTINELIADKEIDAEIERYIKQFWPRPEHGGAVRLGFKRAVRWMQERQVQPVKNEELYEKFKEAIIGFEHDAQQSITGLSNKCLGIAERYAASKLNNTIEDKWISVENKLPEPGYEYLCYDDENDNCDVWYYDEDGFGYLGDTKKSVTHWQYLPKAPNQ